MEKRFLRQSPDQQGDRRFPQQGSSQRQGELNLYKETAENNRQRTSDRGHSSDVVGRISDAEILQKLGDQWAAQKSQTLQGREVSLFSHNNPNELRERDPEKIKEEVFRQAGELGVDYRKLDPPLDSKTSAYECFGDTLAHGKGRMHRADAEIVLKDNFRQIQPSEAQKDDVIAYRYNKQRFPRELQEFAEKEGYEQNRLLHLERVSSADHSEYPSEIWAEGKLGDAGKYPHEPHDLVNAYGSNYHYYRALSGDGSINEA
jgi:hypothetical protein